MFRSTMSLRSSNPSQAALRLMTDLKEVKTDPPEVLVLACTSILAHYVLRDCFFRCGAKHKRAMFGHFAVTCSYFTLAVTRSLDCTPTDTPTMHSFSALVQSHTLTNALVRTYACVTSFCHLHSLLSRFCFAYVCARVGSECESSQRRQLVRVECDNYGTR